MRGITSLIALAALAVSAAAQTRESLTNVTWGTALPEPPADGAPLPEGATVKPLVVYVESEEDSKDQERFEATVLPNETFKLATKFFETVRVTESVARDHALFKGIPFTAPAIVVFDSRRKTSGVAGGRASAMKAYQVMCQVGQADYETDLGTTVQTARNLLGLFDQVEAANGAMSVKQNRAADARAKGDTTKARQLEKELEVERAANEKLLADASARWAKVWDVKPRKK